jgi:hypothetical protein
MRDVLLHLERVGFDAAPRWLGVDDRGRDILSWIEGDTFTDRSQMHPYIGDPPVRLAFSDEQVAAAMRLLRRYHDTFTEARWSSTATSVRGISCGETASRSR